MLGGQVGEQCECQEMARDETDCEGKDVWKSMQEGRDKRGEEALAGGPGAGTAALLSMPCASRPEGGTSRSERFLWRLRSLEIHFWKVSSHLFSICHVLSALLWEQSHYTSPRSQRQSDPPGLAPSRPQSVPPVKEELIQLPRSLRDAPANPHLYTVLQRANRDKNSAG